MLELEFKYSTFHALDMAGFKELLQAMTCGALDKRRRYAYTRNIRLANCSFERRRLYDFLRNSCGNAVTQL